MGIASDDWEQSERGLSFAVEEAKRLFRRSRPRRLALIALALLCASAYPIKRSFAKRVYDAELSLRIVEADKELTAVVKPSQHYLDLIWKVFLSGPTLKKIIARHHIYPDKFERDPQLAVETMRDDMDVKVWRNYFIEDYGADDDEARSARVSVTWRYKDPDVALAVVRELGETIMEAQGEERRVVFAAAQVDIDEAADAQFEHLVALRRAIDLKRIEQRGAPELRRAAVGVELNELLFEEQALAKEVTTMSSDRTRFELSVASENERSGLRFELVEPGLVVPEPASGPPMVAVTTAAIFVLGILLGGVVAGAFEVKLRQPSDVWRLGVPVLGAVPAFPGDAVGTLAERLRTEDRIRSWDRQ